MEQERLTEDSTHDGMLGNPNDHLGNDHEKMDIPEITEDVVIQHQMPTKPEFFQLGFDASSTTPDFLLNENKCKGMGIRFLTGKAFNVNPEQVTKEEARFCLQLSSLLIQLSDPQKKILSDILATAGNNGNKELSIFRTIRLPTTKDDFDRFFLTGKHAIMPNLPHPVPKTSADGTHSYVKLSDVLANELGKAVSFDDYDFYTKLQIGDKEEIPSVSATPHAKELLMRMQAKQLSIESDVDDEFIMYLWLREWRDDFDPNNTKSSRNQVWCNTFTICPPTLEEHNGRHTYFMSLASKGDDHSGIEECLTQELQELSSTGLRVYHGGMKRIVKIVIDKLLISVDRPERTTIFQLGDHNGTYSSCWGYATHVDGSCRINHLPSCEECRKKRKQRIKQHQYSIPEDGRSPNCRICSDWSLEDPKLVFLAPAEYPQKFDIRTGAPIPPKFRDLWYNIEDVPDTRNNDEIDQETPVTVTVENSIGTGRKRRKRQKKTEKRIYLQTVRLCVDWLKSAVVFACHNAKTRQPGGRQNQMMWTKGNFTSYLKTCGCTNKIIDSIYRECVAGSDQITLPVCWNDVRSLAKCHYAPMHMLFLGHVKSNIDMISKWMGKYNKLAPFGKEANKFLTGIRGIRATKYFCAQPLSTSSWGTGTWVSENYLLGARIWKFVLSVPALMDQRLMQNDSEYKQEWLCVARFVNAMASAFGRIMSKTKVIDGMYDYILQYLDCMVELDEILFRSDRQKRNPNFVKSNSLGILACASSHATMGPAILHWEGGFAGERKIQQVKPLLSIKRATADWNTITLRKLYQHDTLNWMMGRLDEEDGVTKQTRDAESLVKIFKSRQTMEEDCRDNSILCAILGKDGSVYLPFRPIGEERGNTRRLVKLVRISFDDSKGEWTTTRCWTAPITIEEQCMLYESITKVKEDVMEEILLLLPQLSKHSGKFMNKYYAVGHLWRERMSDGEFSVPEMDEVLFPM